MLAMSPRSLIHILITWKMRLVGSEIPLWENANVIDA